MMFPATVLVCLGQVTHYHGSEQRFPPRDTSATLAVSFDRGTAEAFGQTLQLIDIRDDQWFFGEPRRLTLTVDRVTLQAHIWWQLTRWSKHNSYYELRCERRPAKY
jgi:hypothetical protein